MKTKKITLGLIIGWVLGVMFIAVGFMALVSSDILAGIFSIAIAVVIFPPISRIIEEKYHLVLSRGVKILLVIVLLFGLGYFSGNSQKKAVSENKNDTPPSLTQMSNTPVSQVKDVVATPAESSKPKTVEAASSKSYQQIFSFSGNGAKKSEPFTVTGSRFKVKYDCQGDFCQAFLYPVKSKLPEIIMNTSGSTRDETIVYGSGDYYIQANTIGSYTMTVEDYR